MVTVRVDDAPEAQPESVSAQPQSSSSALAPSSARYEAFCEATDANAAAARRKLGQHRELQLAADAWAECLKEEVMGAMQVSREGW